MFLQFELTYSLSPHKHMETGRAGLTPSEQKIKMYDIARDVIHFFGSCVYRNAMNKVEVRTSESTPYRSHPFSDLTSWEWQLTDNEQEIRSLQPESEMEKQ